MTATLRNSILILSLLFAVINVSLMSAGENEDAAPEIIAVKFHADWCGSCKAMGNVFEELQAKFDTKPVLYVTLDHTRDFNRKQSKFLAESLGLGDVWKQNNGKTGFILLVDGKTRKVITRLKSTQTLKEMGAELVAAVEKTSVRG